MRTFLSNLGLLLTLIVAIAINPCSASTIHVLPGEKKVYCCPGDTIVFTGTSARPSDAAKFVLFADGNIVDSTSATIQSATWVAPDAGEYTVFTKYVTLSGQEAGRQRYRIIVLAKRPVIFGPVPTDTLNDTDLSFTIDTTSDFTVSYLKVYWNDVVVADNLTAPYKAQLKTSWAQAGPYTISFDAYDADGNRWHGEEKKIIVDKHIEIDPPQAMTLDDPKDMSTFTARCGPDITPVSVTYYIGNRQVGTSSEAPFTVTGNLSDCPSGSYDVAAIVQCADGRKFDDIAYNVVLTNKPDDENRKEDARRRAAAQAQMMAGFMGMLANAMKGPDVYLVR